MNRLEKEDFDSKYSILSLHQEWIKNLRRLTHLLTRPPCFIGGTRHSCECHEREIAHLWQSLHVVSPQTQWGDHALAVMFVASKLLHVYSSFLFGVIIAHGQKIWLMPLFRRMLKSCQELECAGRELPSISPCQKIGHEEVQTIYLWRCSDFGSTTYHVNPCSSSKFCTSMRSIKVHRFWGIPVGSQSSKLAPFPTDHRQTSGIYPENGNVSCVIYYN